MARAIAAGHAAEARRLYRERFAPLVKASGIMDSNTRTVAAFLAVLAAQPLWLFVFELTALNLALVGLAIARSRANRELVRRLATLV
jgi:hypothetical protein